MIKCLPTVSPLVGHLKHRSRSTKWTPFAARLLTGTLLLTPMLTPPKALDELESLLGRGGVLVT